MNDNLLDQKSHFAFGKNWLDYAAKIDEPKIARAVSDLQRLAGRERLDGLSFLDIGCGSGLHALAAIRLGAARVMGVDIDSDSVEASRRTLARFAPQANARFETRSVFDMLPEQFGGFDIVYSWGVLHHTGDMDRAITCAAALVAPDGAFLVALYRKTPFCGMWRVIKRWYSHATPVAQRRARYVYICLVKLGLRVMRLDFNKFSADYYRRRGMDFFNDVHDWLGGYPYQSISPGACRVLLDRLGFRLEWEFLTKLKLAGVLGSGCDEYGFRRASGVIGN